MTEELVDEPFATASKHVNDAYDRAADELKAKVEKAKSDALKKVSG
jgi:hypothetical protein